MVQTTTKRTGARGGLFAVAAIAVFSARGADAQLDCPENSHLLLPLPTRRLLQDNPTISDCVVDSGYYLSAPGVPGVSAGTIKLAPADTYSGGGTPVDSDTARPPTDCPPNSSSPAGSARIVECACNLGRLMYPLLTLPESANWDDTNLFPWAADPYEDDGGAVLSTAIQPVAPECLAVAECEENTFHMAELTVYLDDAYQMSMPLVRRRRLLGGAQDVSDLAQAAEEIVTATGDVCIQCPTGTTTLNPVSEYDSDTFCDGIAAGYYGTLGRQGAEDNDDNDTNDDNNPLLGGRLGSHADVTRCPANSISPPNSLSISDCVCNTGYRASGFECVFNGTEEVLIHGSDGASGSDFPEWGIALAGVALALSAVTSVFVLIQKLCCSGPKYHPGGVTYAMQHQPQPQRVVVANQV
jgi:hypothetical protein